MRFSLKNFFKDSLAILLLGSIGTYFGWQFYQDLNVSLENQDGQVLGFVQELSNSPQRKFDGRTLWASLEQNSLLYINDTIKTYENDRIVLMLNDGTELVLEPNSMIRLEGARISFNSGSISAINRSGESAIEIATEDGDLLTLDQGAINLEQQEGEELSFSVSEGSATLSTKDGTQQEVEKNQNVTLGEEGPQFDRFTIELLEPAMRSYWVSYQAVQSITLEWTSPEEDSYRVLISDTPDFTNLILDQNTQENRLSVDLEEGDYYWKVEAPGQSSITWNFTLFHETPPTLKLPTPDQRFSYRSQVPRIPFQWSDSKYAPSYLVEISDREDFSSISHRREVQGSIFFMDDLAPGEYWWRVSPSVVMGPPGSWHPSVEVGHFILEQNLNLEAVRLLYPHDEGVMNHLSDSQGMRFSWAPHSEALEYRLEISQQEDFSSLDFQLDQQGTNHFYELPPVGEYYWRVGGTSFDGLPLPYSEVHGFQVVAIESTLSLLEPQADVALERYAGHVEEFQWQSQNQGFYRFQLWHSPWGSLDEVLIEDSLSISQETMTVLPEPGKYMWKVSVINQQGEAQEESDLRYFYMEEPFIGPEIQSPMEGASFRLIGQAELAFQWDTLEGADRYVARLFHEGNSFPIREFNSNDDTLWEMEELNRLNTGGYTLTVQGIRNEAPQGFPRESTITSRNFRVDEVSIYRAGTLMEPPDEAIIEQTDFLRTGILFSWNQESRVSNHELNIYSGPDNEAPLYRFPLNQSYYRLRELPPGQYYWEIASRDNQGYDAPSSERRSFTLKALRELGRPVITSPRRGETVDMTERDNLYFQWRAVEEAQYYRFSLYNNQGEMVFQNNHVEGTEWTIHDLTILDIGEFQMEIQAESYYEDLALTRTSLPTRQSFIISLEELEGIPQIITTEVQYGD